MAHAPTPGVSRRAEEVNTAKRILVIKLGWTGETYRLAVNNVPLDHRMAVRKATGMSLTAFIGGEDSIDVDSIAVLAWVARRMNGNASLSWRQFQRDWPEEIGEGDIDVWAEDPTGQRVDEEGRAIDEEGNALPPSYDVADSDTEELDDPQS